MPVIFRPVWSKSIVAPVTSSCTIKIVADALSMEFLFAMDTSKGYIAFFNVMVAHRTVFRRFFEVNLVSITTVRPPVNFIDTPSINFL